MRKAKNRPKGAKVTPLIKFHVLRISTSRFSSYVTPTVYSYTWSTLPPWLISAWFRLLLPLSRLSPPPNQPASP